LALITSNTWRFFYKNFLEYLADMEEDLIEDLAVLGAGFYREAGVRQIATAADLGMYALWTRTVNVFGAQIVVFKLVGNIAAMAAWQRDRCPLQVNEHMSGMSDLRQAYRVSGLHVPDAFLRSMVQSYRWKRRMARRLQDVHGGVGRILRFRKRSRMNHMLVILLERLRGNVVPAYRNDLFFNNVMVCIRNKYYKVCYDWNNEDSSPQSGSNHG
jgi:hypothetical protein